MKYLIITVLLLLSCSIVAAENLSVNKTNTSVTISVVDYVAAEYISDLEAMAVATGVVDGNVLSVELNFSEFYNRTTYVVRVERLDNGEVLVAEVDALTGQLMTNYNEVDFSEREDVGELNRVLVLEDGVTPVGISPVLAREPEPRRNFWQKILHWFKNPFG